MKNNGDLVNIKIYAKKLFKMQNYGRSEWVLGSKTTVRLHIQKAVTLKLCHSLYSLNFKVSIDNKNLTKAYSFIQEICLTIVIHLTQTNIL